MKKTIENKTYLERIVELEREAKEDNYSRNIYPIANLGKDESEGDTFCSVIIPLQDGIEVTHKNFSKTSGNVTMIYEDSSSIFPFNASYYIKYTKKTDKKRE